jgi:hypothetical protein
MTYGQALQKGKYHEAIVQEGGAYLRSHRYCCSAFGSANIA